MNIQFQYPDLLWLLLAVPVFGLLYFFNLYRRKKAIQRIGNPALIKELYKTHSSAKAAIKFAFFTIAFALGCIALANPRKPEEGLQQVRKGIDIMVALDVSNSMLAADLQPNRLQQAKEVIDQLIQKSGDDRIGLVLFAGTAFIQMPLTYDHNAAQLFTAGASPSVIRSQGTAIGDALEKCENAFDQQSERFKAIVLISDGETHDESALRKAKNLADKGIMINTIGVGSPAGATILDTATNTAKRDASGNIIVSKLNEELLQQIADVTNGAYIHLTNPSQTVGQLTAQLSQIQKKALGDATQFIYKTYYLWLALPMLLLMLAEIFTPDRKKLAL
ncbi:VWA domain-containing protein [Chitinophagaceae bacterium LB-8]|uniref:VWA domain-containing protein n=1 Tax=Paraflavisolibacter caeni TaxID=2982496 RepID=A0A9X2XZE3_9BACT|nr:VWA domain-containing protein [Paraflavisolibacter caeni]MCU7552394.1 VWA domain-containing protein [Paraflavisolibacter caeni]